jgi:hypothetical protein
LYFKAQALWQLVLLPWQANLHVRIVGGLTVGEAPPPELLVGRLLPPVPVALGEPRGLAPPPVPVAPGGAETFAPPPLATVAGTLVAPGGGPGPPIGGGGSVLR